MSNAAAALSFWHDSLPPTESRSPLPGPIDVDVAIVGAGYSGLWTAYYLLANDPLIRVAIIERDFAGFGASGRNGGWCIGELAADDSKLAKAGTIERATAQTKAMFDAVDEVGRVASARGIECDFAKGGTIRLARNKAQWHRQTAEISHLHSLGFDETDARLLGPEEAEGQLAATGVVGGLFFAHTAVLHPAKLAVGLADLVVSMGAALYEQTAASVLEPGRVMTDRGEVRAETVVRATEGFTRDLRHHRRRLAPLYSLMIATEPLAESQWAEIGLADRASFSDDRHLVIYGQRTADGRIAFGGRGAPYGFGSRIDPAIETKSGTHDLIARTLHELLPQTRDVAVTHRWGGVLGVPRNWFPTVAFDPSTGMGHLGGYVGEGVAAANLAGRTLADLIAGRVTDRTTYPWVNHSSRRWEPEPLRWIAINGALRGMASADEAENRTGKPSRLATALYRLIK